MEQDYDFWPLIQSYVDFVLRKYGKATIIFDGYNSGPCTKDSAHLQRKHLKTSLDIRFDEDMLVSDTRDAFLSNEANKQRLIDKLASALPDRLCKTMG